MKKQVYTGLQFFCRNSENESVSEILKEFKTPENLIDLLHNDGLFFKSAISHDNNALLQILLDYMYNTKQIEKDPKDNNTDQSIKYNKLQEVLKEAKSEFSTSKEILSLIDNICHEDTDYNSGSDSLYGQDITNLCSSFNNLEDVKVIFDEYIAEHKQEIETAGDVIHTEAY